MLKLRNISKSYKTGNYEQKALDNVSVDFRKNEFVAILGPSGSGKSTLLNIIGGLDKYDTGDLIINNKSTKQFKDRDWDAYRNNCIGFVFQNYNLITHISVLQNVELAMTLSGVSNKERKKRAKEALEKVGLKDHMHKKPNQLSGGQMQRVAIARALVNNPDIIMADEPTGALDTKTSVQIMELITEIAKDKLVIMVTHNAELANQYASRIIELRDGKLVSDSNPITEEGKEENQYQIVKTSMGFWSALKLSFNNIRTKKGRTLLTAFAASIGIIGIALILSLSNGFDKKIDEFEQDTLSSFPVMISTQAMNIDLEELSTSESGTLLSSDKVEEQHIDALEAYSYNAEEDSKMHENNLSKEYIEYLEKMDKNLISGISYYRMTGFNLLNKIDDKVNVLNSSTINFKGMPKEFESENVPYMESSYDLLYGKLAESKEEIVLEVDSKNRVDEAILNALGIEFVDGKVDFKDIVGTEFKLVLNDDYYTKVEMLRTMYMPNMDFDSVYENENNITLKIVGIVRAKSDNTYQNISAEVGSTMGNATSGSVASIGVGSVMYHNDLIEYVLQENSNSEIVTTQKEANYNVLTGEAIEDNEAGQQVKDSLIYYLGGEDHPIMINIHPIDFETKDQVVSYLDQYNEGKEEKDQVLYTDMAKEFSDLSGNIMDAITIVLVAFSAISLVVSSIMIGIITYISVLERTKEIGILRSIGARKKDITRVFNAETFIIGLCSGILGIGIAQLLTYPINQVLYDLTNLEQIAQLNPLHALILLLISIALTLIGGAIPAKIAAKKDPVEALRTE